MSIKINIKEKLKEINNKSKYEYKLIKEYKNNKDKCIEAYCKEHNYKWITKYNSITSNQGCYYCGINKNKNSRKLDINKIKDNFNFHVEVIDEYINNHTNNIKCTCKKCRYEWITNISKLKYSSCKNCNIKPTRNKMIESINKLKDKFPELDFSEFNPKNLYEKSIVKCIKHKTKYKKSYINLKYYFNETKVCKDCEREIKEKHYLNILNNLNTNFIFKFKNGFKNISTRNLEYTCQNDHTIITTYHKFLDRRYCSKCNKSKPEIEIVNYIKKYYDKNIIENDRNTIKNNYSNQFLELDIYLPDIKLAIEFNGSYWHSDEYISKTRIGFNSAKEYHNYKSNKCKEKGINLLHINEEEWKINKDGVLNNIKSKILK